MTLSTLTLLTAVITALTLNINSVTSQTVDPRLAEELKCLNKRPVDQCNLAVTYQPPVNALACDQFVPESQYVGLNCTPSFHVPYMKSPIREGLLVMFDPDNVVSDRAIDGTLHWIVKVVVDNNGYLVVKSTVIDYFKPTPPRGDDPHRYQFFLFRFGLDSKVSLCPGRTFQLCPFIAKNYLGQPVAAFQFRFKRA